MRKSSYSKNSYKLLILCLILNFLFVTCSSYKFTIKPTALNSFWEQGREYVSESDNEVEIIICHERNYNNNLVYYVEITNLMSQPRVVDPSSFYYSFINTNMETTSKQKIFSINPELQIDKVDKDIVQENNSHTLTSTTNTACLFTGCLLGVFNIFSGDFEEASENIDTVGEVADTMEEERISHEDEITRLESERSYWADTVLRKTTLFEGQTIGGLVNYPISKGSKIITLYFPIGNSEFKFEYEQKQENM